MNTSTTTVASLRSLCFIAITLEKHCNHTTTMKLTCAVRHLCLCALPNIPIPIKLPGDKSDTSPSAPDEPKHICEHCRKPMHGGTCGQNFRDVHDTLDKTKLYQKDANKINPIATICLPCYRDLLLTKIITSPAPANLSIAKTKTTKYQRNRRPAIRLQLNHSLTNEVMKAISMLSCF
jgi:hypothetical protein